MPLLTAVSPTLVPRPQGWPDFVHMTGFWYLDAADAYKPPAKLLAFLNAGLPTVYVGFGSMAGFDPQATLEMLLEALGGRRAGHRCQLREGKQSFGRDTAAQEAHPTEPWLVRDQRDIQPQISRTKSRGVSAWSATNDQHLSLDG